jgi:hypothetical protein
VNDGAVAYLAAEFEPPSCFGRRKKLCVMARPPDASHAGQVHRVPGQREPPSDLNSPPWLVLDRLMLVPVGSRPIRQLA